MYLLSWYLKMYYYMKIFKIKFQNTCGTYFVWKTNPVILDCWIFSAKQEEIQSKFTQLGFIAGYLPIVWHLLQLSQVLARVKISIYPIYLKFQHWIILALDPLSFIYASFLTKELRIFRKQKYVFPSRSLLNALLNNHIMIALSNLRD